MTPLPVGQTLTVWKVVLVAFQPLAPRPLKLRIEVGSVFWASTTVLVSCLVVVRVKRAVSVLVVCLLPSVGTGATRTVVVPVKSLALQMEPYH